MLDADAAISIVLFFALAATWLVVTRRRSVLRRGQSKRDEENTWAPGPPAERRMPTQQQQAHVPAQLLARLGRGQASPGAALLLPPPQPASPAVGGAPAHIGTPAPPWASSSPRRPSFATPVPAPVALGALRYHVEVRLGTPLWGAGVGELATPPPARPPGAPVPPWQQPVPAAVQPARGPTEDAPPPPPPPGGAGSRLPTPDFEVRWEELVLGDVLGQGAFGRVHRARWRGSVVAVKTVIAPPSLTLVDDFAAEVAVISSLRHPNVLLFMAACTASPTHLALVTELAPQGSLWDLIHRAGAAIPVARVLDVALGIARGMAYLHSARPSPILHRDLKSGNVLLDGHGTVKVSDFGLARVKASAFAMTGGIGTFQWMAPEVLGNQPYAESADVYSFGVILWEMLARQVPYAAQAGNQMQVAIAVMTKGLRPSLDAVPRAVYPPALLSLMLACWDEAPHTRPTFLAVIAVLEGLAHGKGS